MEPLKPLNDDLKIQFVHRWGATIRAQGWPYRQTLVHLGSYYGQLGQYGYSDENVVRIMDALVQSWVEDGPAPPEASVPPLAQIGNAEIIELADKGLPCIPESDETGTLDFGVQFGQRIQAGATLKRAYYECGEWLVYWGTHQPGWSPCENPWPLGGGGTGTHADPIQGVARLADGGAAGMEDASGRRLFWGVHAGDLVARLLHGGEAFVDDEVGAMASVGAHFVRTWTFLSGDWWATPPRPGECYPGKAGYWDAVRAFARILRRHRVQWLVSQGDLFRIGWPLHQMQDFMRQLAQLLAEEGGLELVIGVDAGNENASAGNPTPETMARVLDPFLAILRPALISTTSNDENDLNRYVSRVCTVCDSHAGRWPFTQAIERCWTAGYWDGKARPLLVSSEPFGVGCQEYPGDNRVGHHISATAEPRDWDDIEAMGCAAAAHFLSRQVYTYMSSPGVISDESFTNYPALELTGWLAQRLPRDIQTWRIFHGGDNRSFSRDRILGVPAGDRARCEHAVSGSNYVVFVHGQAGTHLCPAINGFSGVRIDLGTKEETAVSWSAGGTQPVSFRRGCLYIGVRT